MQSDSCDVKETDLGRCLSCQNGSATIFYGKVNRNAITLNWKERKKEREKHAL